MARLLVSVRSAAEAMIALEGGADLIDVKEPLRGPLGKADDAVIAEVVQAVAGRVPVSAAMGEWVQQETCKVPGLRYVKWGLSGPWASARETQAIADIRCCVLGDAEPVLVAYADAGRAKSPEPSMLARAAVQIRFAAFLIDTHVKDGSTLLDWMTIEELFELRRLLATANIPLALAGSLTRELIQGLLPLNPSWFAVRGAVCEGGREGFLTLKRVIELTSTLN